ncbi:hypothetical protein Droror1_Dr00015175 [Drosera rotundifolia]
MTSTAADAPGPIPPGLSEAEWEVVRTMRASKDEPPKEDSVGETKVLGSKEADSSELEEAEKSSGFSTWSLRVNPSSGNLHPIKAYLIAPPIESLSSSPFVAHYAPKEQGLEIRAQIPSGFFEGHFPPNSFLVAFSSIFWREAWKYGERAFRYCNHDIGHAIAAVSIAAAGLGWDVKMLDELGYHDLENLMGLGFFPEFKNPSRPVEGKFPEIEF